MMTIVENKMDDAEPDIEEEMQEAELENEVAEDNDAKVLLPLEDRAQQKRVIEALLFASPEPVGIKHMQNRLPESADVGGILLELQAEYQERGVHLVRLEDVWAFRTAVDIGPYLALAKKEEKKLSRAALETMAIIAYHQPVTRAEVENIRGVATNKGTLDALLESGWIKPGRRRETPGRPVTWTTTNQFLDDFGVGNLNDLPGLQELKASGLLDTRPAIETIPGADLFTSANENTPEDNEKNSTPFEQLGEFDQQNAEEEIMEEDQDMSVSEEMNNDMDSEDNSVEMQGEEQDVEDEDSDESSEDDLDDEDLDDDDDDSDDDDDEDEEDDDEEDE